MSNQKPYNDSDDPLYYAPPWLNERNGGRYSLNAANGNGRGEPAPPAQRRPNQRPADPHYDQRRFNQGSSHSRRAKASQAQEARPDIFAEAVARALELEFEPEFVEVPAALREHHSLGFAAKATLAVVAAALVALAYVFFVSAPDDISLATLPT